MQQASYSHDAHKLWMPKDIERRFLTAPEVASYCSVPIKEVLSWIDAGLLRASCPNHGNYRIAAGDFVAFIGKFEICL